MTVSVDGDIEVLRITCQLTFHVCDHDSRVIFEPISSRGVADLANDSKAAEQPHAIPFIVSETAEQRTLQIAQRRDGERRHQIAREEDTLTLQIVEHRDDAADVVQMVMRIREDADFHKWNKAAGRREIRGASVLRRGSLSTWGYLARRC